MCIRDRLDVGRAPTDVELELQRPAAGGRLGYLDRAQRLVGCLLYTSDAADDLLCVDLGGRRITKKKNTVIHT